MAKTQRRITRAMQKKANGKKELPKDVQEKLREIGAQTDKLRFALASLDLDAERIEEERRRLMAQIVEKNIELRTTTTDACKALGYDVENARLNVDLTTMLVTPAAE